MIGQTIAHYRITAKLGEGGMGEVYRATDTKLGRDVALKILPPSFAADADRMARFEREAKVLAALNHPHVAQIYGVEDRALVMELVEGETVDSLIKPGPLPLDTALEYAGQIAEALEAAHEKGIVHRDLKPANIKVTPQGVVKVLDFGLAAVVQPAAGNPSNPETSPTFTMSPTRAGMILGTAAYMSPEQARGKPADKRADIWAFGVVLYEMLAGKRLFHGETITDILASVVKDEPDLSRVSPNVRRLLRACLQKDPKQRLQSIGDWRLLLDAEADEAASRGPLDKELRGGPPHEKWLWPGVAAVLLIALGTVSFIHSREKPPAAPEPVRFQIYPPEKTVFGPDLALSPDGRRIAFTATGVDGRTQLWVRNLDALESRPLPGTEGVDNAVFWSPDSRFLAFAEGARLKKIDISGGPPVTLCDLPYIAGLGSWSPLGVLLVGGQGSSPLWRVSASGGPAIAVTRLDPAQQGGRHSFVSFLPDGRHFVYLQQSSPGAENGGIYLGSLDSTPEGQPRKRLLATSFGAQYAPSSDPRTGYVLFLRESTLSAQRFDAERLELVGDPVPIAEQVGNQNGVKGLFTVSANSILAFRAGARTGSQLTWFDRQGKVMGTVGDIDMMERPSISPDGRTVAIDRRDLQAGRYDIWLHDLVRGTASRLTSNSTNNRFPIWSPDGGHVAYYTPDLGGGLHQKAASGVGQDEVLSQTLPRGRPMDWSRDGRYIIKGVSDPNTKLDIWVFPLFGDRKPFPYLHSEFNESNARLSPDGQWLAYASDETKRNEVYVQTFPNPTGKWQVSTTGGDLPVWSRDGKELFFLAGGKMMAAEVKSGSKFEAGVPKALFEVHLETGAHVSFDVSKDGRFLIPTRPEDAAAAPITVVVNWTAALK
jgi:eukaryotic-like serine/threonine-protein kinase